MATSDIAVQSSNYTGNVNLGGGTLGVVQIDTRPLEQLAQYTYYYNREMYQQKQKSMEEQAKELAEITAYDANSPILKDRDHLYKGLDNIINFIRDNKNVQDFQKNREGYIKLKKLKGDWLNDAQGGKVRRVMYLARQEEISKITDPAEKDRQQKKLDGEASSTDIRTPIQHSDDWKIVPVKITAAPQVKKDITVKTGNSIIERTITVIDMKAAKAMSAEKELGLDSEYIPETSAKFKAANADLQNLYRDRNEALKNSGRLEPIASAEILSGIIKEYKKGDEPLDVDTLVKENANNSIVGGALGVIQAYNKKMAEMREAITSGQFTDKFGAKIPFDNRDVLDIGDYEDINIEDGVTARELILARTIGATPADSWDTKVVQTDEQLKNQRLGLDAKKADTDRMYKLGMLGVARDKAAIQRKNINDIIKNRNRVDEIDNDLENYHNENLIRQPSLVFGTTGSTKVAFGLKSNTSFPIIDLNGNVIPPKNKSAIRVYDKYEKPPTYNKDGTIKNAGEPATGAKIVAYENGEYDLAFKDRETQKSYTQQQIMEGYRAFKSSTKDWKGSLDQWLKMGIENKLFDVDVVGKGGAVSRKLTKSALQIINNKNQKKGQSGIFDYGNDGGEDALIQTESEERRTESESSETP